MKYRVGIDAGHGGRNHGAKIGAHQEKGMTLAYARYLQRWLSRLHEPVEPILIRSDDSSMTFAERGRHSREQKLDLVVCLHFNACPAGEDTTYWHSALAFYPPEDMLSRLAANTILRAYPPSLSRSVGARVAFSAAIADSRQAAWLERPGAVMAQHAEHTRCVLLELCYLSNERDMITFAEPIIHDGIAAAILCGIDALRYEQRIGCAL